jgi:hypothetical protein
LGAGIGRGRKTCSGGAPSWEGAPHLTLQSVHVNIQAQQANITHAIRSPSSGWLAKVYRSHVAHSCSSERTTREFFTSEAFL